MTVMSKNKITNGTVMSVLRRSRGRCENPKCRKVRECQLHHVFFRSQYLKDDKHFAWNLANICHECHDSIHHTGGIDGMRLNVHLKSKSYYRYRGRHKEELYRILKQVRHKLETYEKQEKSRTIGNDLREVCRQFGGV